MKLVDLLPQFKRYAIIERGITPRVTKDILKTVQNLIESNVVSTVNNSTTKSIRCFLYDQKVNRSWGNRTFRNKRQYLKSFYDYCIRYGYMNVNPVEKIEKPKIAKSLPRFLRKDEVDKLLLCVDTFSWKNELEAKRNKAIIRTYLYSGIRLSELLKLKTIDTLFEDRVLVIRNGKGNKDRLVPIHPSLYPYLVSYEKTKKKKTEFLFSSINSDSGLTIKNLYRIIKVIRNESRVYFSPHMLRHTMARRAIESNLNPFHLQTILGHADISTTQIYVSSSLTSVKESFSKLIL